MDLVLDAGVSAAPAVIAFASREINRAAIGAGGPPPNC